MKSFYVIPNKLHHAKHSLQMQFSQQIQFRIIELSLTENNIEHYSFINSALDENEIYRFIIVEDKDFLLYKLKRSGHVLSSGIPLTLINKNKNKIIYDNIIKLINLKKCKNKHKDKQNLFLKNIYDSLLTIETYHTKKL